LLSIGLGRRGLGGGGGLPLFDVAGDSETDEVLLTPLRAKGLDGRGGGTLMSMPSGADLLLRESSASEVDEERGRTWR
jgi:hypothetical protein